MIKKAFRSDSVRIIFIPYKNDKSGLFMDGPFNYREMFKVNLKNTLVEKILNNPGCTQITIPSSLICKQNIQALEAPDVQYSVINEDFQAIKYLVISKSESQIFAVVEIGWKSIQQALMIHENQMYLNKKEDKIISMAQESINQTYLKLKLLAGGIKQKNSYEKLKQQTRTCLLKWKRLTFFERF